jgi:hypothetical protein
MCEKPLNPNLPHWKRPKSNVDNYFIGYADGRYNQPKNSSAKRDKNYQKGYERGSAVKGTIVEAPRDKNFFAEALQTITGSEPPFGLSSTGTTGMIDEDMTTLQDWCAVHAQPHWATGLSMIEAAELIVAGAIENGNIKE